MVSYDIYMLNVDEIAQLSAPPSVQFMLQCGAFDPAPLSLDPLPGFFLWLDIGVQIPSIATIQRQAR